MAPTKNSATLGYLAKNGFVADALFVSRSTLLSAFLKGNSAVPTNRTEADNIVAIGTMLRSSSFTNTPIELTRTA